MRDEKSKDETVIRKALRSRMVKVNALREGPPPSLRDTSPKSNSQYISVNLNLHFGFGGGGRGSGVVRRVEGLRGRTRRLSLARRGGRRRADWRSRVEASSGCLSRC